MYRFFDPALPLRPFIEGYWTLNAHPSERLPLREQIYVDGKPDLLINFGAAYLRDGLESGIDTVRLSNIDAQRLYPVRIAQSGTIALIGVRFRPAGLAPFLRVPMHELTNQTLDFGYLFGAAARVLEEQLFAVESSVQVALLDRFFLQRLRPRSTTAILRTLLTGIEAAHGRVAIPALAAQVGYSIRTVDRLFSEETGFSPKVYAQICRFQHALALMQQSPDRPLVAIALAAGYYDQAHFSKEFRRYAGEPPQQVAAQWQQTSVQILQDPAPPDG